MISRRRFLKVAAVSGLGATGALGYTAFVEPHWIEVVKRELPIANLPRDLHGCSLVQISDVHIGPSVDDDYLVRCFHRAGSLSAEIVVYTGDFTSYEPDTLEHFSRLASKFALGRRATFGVLGNHDYGPNWADSELAAGLAERAKAAGIRILRNEVAEHSGLHVVGLDDWWANHFKPELAFKQLSPGVAAVTLSHNPDTADLPGWGNYAGWILAGHTHGGQCKPPFLPPPLLPVRNRRYTAGEFVLTRERRMYINRGIGHLLPVRFNVRPEITHFRLVRA